MFMSITSLPLGGGPEFYGIELTSPEQVTEWIKTTPADSDPREYMSVEERTLFDATITPISCFGISEQQIYFGLIKNGTSLEIAREIAFFDSL